MSRSMRVGTKLVDPAGIYGSFDVAAECSGIRSFIALLAITTIFSALTMRAFWRRVVIMSAVIPLCADLQYYADDHDRSGGERV